MDGVPGWALFLCHRKAVGETHSADMPFVAGDEDSDLSVHEFFERFSATCHPKHPCSCETLLFAAMGNLSLYIYKYTYFWYGNT